MRRLDWFALLFVLTLLLVPVLALAQDAIDPPVPSVPAPDAAVAAFVVFLVALVGSVPNAPITSTLVAVVKRIPAKFIQEMPAPTINLLMSIAVIALVWASDALGFRAYLDTPFKIIIALGGALGLTAGGSQLWYSSFVKGVGVIGTSRDQPWLHSFR